MAGRMRNGSRAADDASATTENSVAADGYPAIRCSHAFARHHPGRFR
jgi:hypothetical protein